MSDKKHMLWLNLLGPYIFLCPMLSLKSKGLSLGRKEKCEGFGDEVDLRLNWSLQGLKLEV